MTAPSSDPELPLTWSADEAKVLVLWMIGHSTVPSDFSETSPRENAAWRSLYTIAGYPVDPGDMALEARTHLFGVCTEGACTFCECGCKPGALADKLLAWVRRIVPAVELVYAHKAVVGRGIRLDGPLALLMGERVK